MKPSILHIAVFAPVISRFDYLPPTGCDITQLKPGIRIKVPFGKRQIVGILLAVDSQSRIAAHKLKPVIEILDTEPVLPSRLLQLIHWTADYYHYPLGEVYATALPVLLRQGKPAQLGIGKKKSHNPICIGPNTQKIENLISTNSTQMPLTLNTQQQQAVRSVINSLQQFQTFLLHGVTGSGKTEVYLRIITEVLSEKKQALVLVPEISLTPQMVARFQQCFSMPIGVLHSGLTDRERLDVWVRAHNGTLGVVIGTRSAIFTPLLNPGIIIIDEEHDSSFKQQEGLRYSARDLAIVRARLEKIPVVLGSATPSLESFYNAEQKRYHLLQLTKRVGNAIHPQFHILDIRNQKLNGGLSNTLIQSIQTHLQNNGQVLLFLNRRGFAPLLFCNSCGWIAACKRCDAKLIQHHYPPLLQCHHCGSVSALITECPACQSNKLASIGQGTQRLEKTLAAHFPDIGIVRIDRDSTRRKDSLQNILNSIHSGQNRILIGTQMLAKGHHFPNVTLVAILNADGGLFSADFRASERMMQLLVQVSGRAGRAERLGEVIIQTHHPEHPLLTQLLQQNYAALAKTLLAERAIAQFPPNGHLVLFRAEAMDKQHPMDFLQQLRNLAQNLCHPTIKLLGPVPSVMEKRAGRYRAQLLMQAPERSPLHNLLKNLLEKIETLPLIRRVRWALDVDPMEII